MSLLLTLLLAATQPATSPSSFQPPANWQKVERDGLTIYVAPDAKEGNSAAIVLYPPAKLAGQDVRAAFDAARRNARGDFKLLRDTEVLPARTEAGDDLLSTQEVLEDPSGRKSLRSLVAVRSGDRYQVCSYVADTIETFTAHAKEAEACMASLSLGGNGGGGATATRPAATRPATRP